MRRLVAAFLLALAPTLGADAQAPDPAPLLARAADYVTRYERDFSGLVGELHETQRIIRPDGTLKRERTLVCDILLVPSPAVFARMPVTTRTFRDVISVDGKPVHDRDDRLRKLFVNPSKNPTDQALRIAREGARYDIGMRHVFDTLMLPLNILRPELATRFRFESSVDGVTFAETRSPALFRSKGLFSSELKDMFLTGSFALDSMGVVHAASLQAASEDIAMSVSIRYETDPRLGVIVPAQAQESLRQPKRPKADHTEVTAVYSNFRRFQVTTEESINSPNRAAPGGR